MKRSIRSFGLLLALATLGASCAGGKGQTKGLKVAVESYHQNLRWKRISDASNFRAPETRAEFLARYLAVEDDLNIDEWEVRGVTFVPNADPVAADVVVTTEAYLLPSTVLEKHVITERWELQGDAWRLVTSSVELAPPTDPPELTRN